MSHVFETTFEDFEKQVIEASYQQPVLLDLWADWCSPCIVIAPILSDVIHERDGQLALAKIEVDEGENMKIAGRYQVRGFPTIIAIQDGEEKGRFSGAKTKAFINEFINDSLGI